MEPNLFSALQTTHVAAWNEKDPAKREQLLKSIYADDIRMYDTRFIFDGLPAVSEFIGQLLLEDPAFHFDAAKDIEPLQHSARLYGTIRTSGKILNSMDFFVLENGKVKHLYAFMEPASK